LEFLLQPYLLLDHISRSVDAEREPVNQILWKKTQNGTAKSH
jgi:hypothetical protein